MLNDPPNTASPLSPCQEISCSSLGQQTNYHPCPPHVNMTKLDVVTNYTAAAVPALELITEWPNLV